MHRCTPNQVVPVSTRQVALHSGLLLSVFGCTGHVGKLAVRPDVAASISSNVTFGRVLIIGASLRPESSRSRFDTASQSSFRIAAIGVRIHEAGLQARCSSGRRRFDQQQHRLCASVLRCVPSQIAPFQHRKSVFIPDCCHRCLDHGVCRPARRFSGRFVSINHQLAILSSFQHFLIFRQDRLQLLQSTCFSFRLAMQL